MATMKKDCWCSCLMWGELFQTMRRESLEMIQVEKRVTSAIPEHRERGGYWIPLKPGWIKIGGVRRVRVEILEDWLLADY